GTCGLEWSCWTHGVGGRAAGLRPGAARAPRASRRRRPVPGACAGAAAPRASAEQVLDAFALLEQLLLREVHPGAAEFVDREPGHAAVVAVGAGDRHAVDD